MGSKPACDETNPLHHGQPVPDVTLIVRRLAEEAIIVSHQSLHSRPEAPPIFVIVLARLLLSPRVEPLRERRLRSGRFHKQKNST